MKRRLPVMAFVIGGLFVIGVLRNLFLNTMDMIIPVLVFGLIFLFYKFPPDRWKQRRLSGKPAPGKRKNPNRKPAPFRVIQGNKRDDEPREDRPRYH